MYDDMGDLSKAFSHLSKGNALRKKHLNYSINKDKKSVQESKKRHQTC